MILSELSKLNHDDVKFDSILEFVSQIKNANIEDVNGIISVPLADLRADEVRPSLTRQQILKNAPKSDGEYFLVPQVVE